MGWDRRAQGGILGMSRPPRAPASRGNRRIALIFVAVIVLTYAAAFASRFIIDSDNVDPTPLPVPTPPTAPTVPPATPVPATPVPEALVSCEGECLVRLPDDGATRDALAKHGITPSMTSKGQVWAAAPAPVVNDFKSRGRPVTLVAPTAETLPLYVVRMPDGVADDALVRQAGEIIDQVENQYVVRMAEVPPGVDSLTQAGLSIEKFPPFPTTFLDNGGELPPIKDLGALAEQVSSEELQATIIALQGMSSRDGTGIGTRHYTAEGNVMAAEYLYQRFAAYGLKVWYEDFVTSDGLLALNVVAELPGTDPSASYLVLGHFDSLNPDDLASAPGADDNATGVAGMLEIARVLSGYKLVHPVRFFATNVEEVGLQGVQALAARAAAEGVPIDGAYNLDAIGSAAHGTQLVLNTDPSGVWLQDLLVEMNDTYGLGQSLLVRQNPIIVADDNFLRDRGFHTVLVARELYGWTDWHHTIADTIEMVDLSNVQGATTLVLLGVASLAGVP